MANVQDLLARLHTEEPSDELRRAIIDLIAESLTEARDNLGYWEKAHFAEAIACVQANVAGGPQPRRAWLTLALVSLEKAAVPPAERDETYTTRMPAVDELRFEDLAAVLRRLGVNIH